MNVWLERQYPTPVSSSPLLPLLLLSLARQKHAPNTATCFQKEYDYIVVGAGSAGSAVASRLSEDPYVSVLLLEAGRSPPLLTELPVATGAYYLSEFDWNYKTVPQKNTAAGLVNREVVLPSGKAVGGSSILSVMTSIRGNPKTFDYWEQQGAFGWSYKNVLPYFMKLENYTDPEYQNNGYHGREGPVTVENLHEISRVKKAFHEAAESLGHNFVDVNGKSQLGFYKLTSTTRDGQRCSSAKAYLVPAENRPNLDILPKAMVTKILIKDGQATGVCFDHDGKKHEVLARREVIVSAGTVETPKLLMLSGIGPKEELEKFGIDVIADLPVGLNLQDLLSPPVSIALDEKLVTRLDKRVTPGSIMEYINKRTGPLSLAHGCFSTAFLKMNDYNGTENDLPDYQLIFFESFAEVILSALKIDPQVFEKVFGPYKHKPLLVCIAQAGIHKSRGTIRLHSTDPYDPPIIDPRYYTHPDDLKYAVEGMKKCLRLAESSPLRELGSHPITRYPGCESCNDEESLLTCMAKTITMTIYHKVGTARMGRIEDPTTVVGPDLKVKTVGRLRVVDASIMPVYSSGNTNLATVMIAEKASDIIKIDHERCHGRARNYGRQRRQ